MAFTLRQLQFFIAAAELGSISAAARQKAISQSSITEAIRSLETDLGIELFERHARGIRLTAKGASFYRHAHQILAEVTNARQAFDEASPKEGGKLSLGITSLVSGYVIADILARFARAFPHIEITLIEDNAAYLQHLLIGGELDVAILLTSSVQDRMALHVESLLTSPFHLWLPLGHKLAQDEAIALGALSNEPLIYLTLEEIEEHTRTIINQITPRPKICFRTRSVEAVRSFVAKGIGLAVLPSLVYRPWSLDGEGIEVRDVSADLPTVQIGLAWRRGAKLGGPARHFVRVAQRLTTMRN